MLFRSRSDIARGLDRSSDRPECVPRSHDVDVGREATGTGGPGCASGRAHSGRPGTIGSCDAVPADQEEQHEPDHHANDGEATSTIDTTRNSSTRRNTSTSRNSRRDLRRRGGREGPAIGHVSRRALHGAPGWSRKRRTGVRGHGRIVPRTFVRGQEETEQMFARSAVGLLRYRTTVL